jgi:2,3-bisphosphoglycerate-independent phosphoglycerate mutase
MLNKKPAILIIMDGYGINHRKKGNAIYAAKKPNIDKYFKNNPYTILSSSGKDVGLLDGQMGNSEVGHLNIGAGRIVCQESLRISKDIKEKGFYKNKELVKIMDYCKNKDKGLHLLGLISDGGVHSLNNHLYALLELAKKKKLSNVFIHCILDGRDVLPKSSLKYLKELSAKTKELGVGKIATIMGRYYAMDRDSVWSRTEKAYKTLSFSEGELTKNFKKSIKKSYEEGVFDEFIKPMIVSDQGAPVANIKPGDGLIFFNFRGDRTRQLCRAFISKNEDFNFFKRKNDYFPLKIVSMTEYDKSFNRKIKAAYKPRLIKNTFGEFVSKRGYKQLRISETTKYAHVTFFFNGGIEKPYLNEERILIPSPKVATFDLKPEMSARKVTNKLISEIKKNKHDFIILNYANGDMVGHSSNFKPTKKAIEVVDECVGLVVEEVLKKKGVAFITADHGNAEQLIDYKSNKAMTSHTSNPVPFSIVGLNDKITLKKGVLGDIVPTMFEVLNIKKPKEMTGKSLVIKK